MKRWKNDTLKAGKNGVLITDFQKLSTPTIFRLGLSEESRIIVYQKTTHKDTTMRESIIQEIIMFRELKKEEIAEHREKLESLNDYLLLEELITSMRKSYYYEGYEDGYDEGYGDRSDECDCDES